MVVLLLVAVWLGIAVPLCLRVEDSLVPETTPPTTLQSKIQVQGDSHSLVHIQERIAASDNHSGGAGVHGPICHLGLIVVIGV